MLGRFSPEYVQAIMDNVAAAAARVQELNLLSKIAAHSTTVSSGQLLGASRDLLATIDMVCSAYRDRHRIGDDTTLRLLLPRWVRGMIRADLTREMAHGADDGNMALSDADINALLTARGLAPTWLLDGQSAAVSGITFPAQGWGEQATGPLLDWPHQLVWNIYAEGTFQHLDAGELTVGVVRDSTLNNTNDYEFFTEVFESVAFRGIEALQVVSTVRPNGLSAGTKDTSTY
jgi:hypothetical protein